VHTPGSGYVLLHHVMGETNGSRGIWSYVHFSCLAFFLLKVRGVRFRELMISFLNFRLAVDVWELIMRPAEIGFGVINNMNDTLFQMVVFWTKIWIGFPNSLL